MSGPVAAIDCGTNTIKLLIGELPGVAEREMRLVRLGQGVDRTGRLADEALERTFAAIDEYAALIAAHQVPPGRIRFCATSATRDAANGEVFAAGVRRRLGVAPEVISGAEEAPHDVVNEQLKGMEVQIPPEHAWLDKEGHLRTENRTKWWCNARSSHGEFLFDCPDGLKEVQLDPE